MTVLQGYGLTETCGMGAILVPEFWNYETVGVPLPSLEIKLNGTPPLPSFQRRRCSGLVSHPRRFCSDYPDAGYLNSNNPPQGEVYLRGGSVTKGYFKRPELNEEASRPRVFSLD
jgi:long-chain acyl-CoA synthetase